MSGNRIFNIECPANLDQTVLCLDQDEFENLQKEPGNPHDSDDIETYQKFLDETHSYDIRQKIAINLYKNGRSYAEIYRNVRQHVLECQDCGTRYVRFLAEYVTRQIKEREKEDKDNPSILEELNRLPADAREAYYLNSLREVDEKYLRILDIKFISRHKPLNDTLVQSFVQKRNPSSNLKGLRRSGLDHDKLFGVN